MPEDPKPEAGPDTGAPAGAEDNRGDGAKPDAGDTDWKAKYEKERDHARTWETRAKQNKADQDELQKLRTERMSESEQAVEQARSEAREAGRAEAALEYGTALVQAEFRGLLAGRLDDEKRLDALVQGLATGSYLKDGGGVDRDALKAWADVVAPKAAFTVPDLGGGARRPPAAVSGAEGRAEALRRFPELAQKQN